MSKYLAALVLAMTLGVGASAVGQTQAGSAADAGADTNDPRNDDQRARDLYHEGDRLYAEGDYEGAIAAFQRAYALSRRPLLLFNLANAFERAGRPNEAAEALRQYLPHAHQTEHDSIAKRIEHLQHRAAMQRESEPEPAPPPAPEPAPAPPVEPGPTPQLEAPVAVAPTQPADNPRRSSAFTTVGWGFAIAGGAALLTSGVAGAIALSARGTADPHCIDGTCREQARDAIERDVTASTVADIALVSGAVLGVTAAVFLLLPEAHPGAEHVRIDLGPGHVGGSLCARF